MQLFVNYLVNQFLSSLCNLEEQLMIVIGDLQHLGLNIEELSQLRL